MMRAAGLERYQRLPVPPELLAETVRALPAAGFAGANVTIPHKEAAAALADERSAAVEAIGAANTLTFDRATGRVRADNTDAPGLLAALPDDPAGRTALVLGAGGSARAAVHALTGAGARVAVWNRTPERARDLGVPVLARPEPADLLVNCTSVGLGDADALPAGVDPRAYPLVVDLVYRPGGTRLVREAERAVDGLEVLVQQGARSFAIWTGDEPDLDRMRAAVGAPSTRGPACR
jgi:shikimate dehydrogenase